MVQEQIESIGQQVNVGSVAFDFMFVFIQLHHAMVLKVDEALMELSTCDIPEGITYLQMQLNRKSPFKIQC